MTLYSYKCEACGIIIDKDFKMGKAQKKVKCPCGLFAVRNYTAPLVKIPNPVSEARVGRGRG